MAASRNESMLAYFEVSMPVGNAREIKVFPRLPMPALSFGVWSI